MASFVVLFLLLLYSQIAKSLLRYMFMIFMISTGHLFREEETQPNDASYSFFTQQDHTLMQLFSSLTYRQYLITIPANWQLRVSSNVSNIAG